MGRVALAMCLAVLLAGCGFHLQGSESLPAALHSLHVRMDHPYRVGTAPLVDALRDRLRAGNRLAGEGDDHGATLQILRLDHVRRVAAVSPLDGRAVAYKLTVTVVFKLDQDGKDLIPEQTLSAQQSYSYDHSQPLAAQEEKNNLLAVLQRRLANQILLRIRVMLNNPRQKTVQT